MTTASKQRFHSIFKDHPSHDDNKIELFSPGETEQENEITAFNTISLSNVVPLRKLKQWPRAVTCPACRELSLTRVERKICGGTHAMAALMFFCTIVGGPLAYMGKQWKNFQERRFMFGRWYRCIMKPKIVTGYA
ncbi:hypothetical protein F53441_9290 [Fusarium austroafricanum]|uniref:LITAF domain-containing protein n=1 Tax=Fusarium austroafricanum TaxID=2364996 RepID=A0A8H4K9H2_9HYPO|nr:hypothetical protein F53441_9290 [Fusarium austroafricanum]